MHLYEEFVKVAGNEAFETSKLAAAYIAASGEMKASPVLLFRLSSLSVAELAKARGQLGQAVRAG